MKKIAYIFGAVLLGLSACKEKAPAIRLVETIALDSYYTMPVPAAEPHNVLIEDFTGVSCPNCPAATDIIKGIISNHPNRINVIAHHIKGNPQTFPQPESKYDFRTDAATTISKSVFNSIPSLPIGGIDRRSGSSDIVHPLLYDRSEWSSIADQRINISDSINLSVTSTFNAATNVANIEVKVVYLYPVNTKQYMSIAIVQDSLEDHQEVGSLVDTAYEFESVLRNFVTTVPFGDPVAPTLATKAAGQVYLRRYTYTIPTTGVNGWTPKHCRVIAFVHQDDANGAKNIYQSKQVKLVP